MTIAGADEPGNDVLRRVLFRRSLQALFRLRAGRAGTVVGPLLVLRGR
jgi:hypothetical protein